MSNRLVAMAETGTGRCVCCSLACAALRICCYCSARRACCCCFSDPPVKPEFSVLCLGLSGVGKTSLLCQLAGEPLPEEPEPTAGFSIKHCALSSAIFQVKELGGTEKLRTYWSMYYSNLDAIIFVVDSTADYPTLRTTALWLGNCLKDSDTSGLPILVLCNKQDLQSATPAQKLSEELQVAQLCEGRQFKVEGCSAFKMEGLRAVLDSFAKMVLEHKKEMGWTEE